MLRPYRRNSERTAILFVKDARSIQIGSAFLTIQRPAKHDLSTSRDKMPKVVPHSCRFGAGYKSNRRPQGGQPRAMFIMRCFVPETIPPTERTRVVRESHRGAYDRETIDKILDEGYVCHVGFAINGQPYVIPTLFARIEDALYFHGSAASRMLRIASDGISVCITVTLTDGFVLARSVFNHSMNYRSVVVLGKAALVDAPEEKLEALHNFTEKILPGRWQDARQPNE